MPFFKERDLEEKSLLKIANCMTTVSMVAGEVVMQYGDTGKNFYFVLAGEVEILVPDYDKMKSFSTEHKSIIDAHKLLDKLRE